MVGDHRKLQNPSKHIKCLPGLYSELRGGHSYTATALYPKATQNTKPDSSVRFFKIDKVRDEIFYFRDILKLGSKIRTFLQNKKTTGLAS